MMNDSMSIEPGQIWETDVSNGRTGKVVVFACQPNFANTFSVWDGDIPANYQLSVGGSVDSRKLIYTNYDNFRCLIDYASEYDMEQIRDRFAESVGIKKEPSKISGNENMKLAIAERERDIWKQVAQNLMSR